MKTIKELIEEAVEAFDIKKSEEIFNAYKSQDPLRFISVAKKTSVAASFLGTIFEHNKEDVVWFLLTMLSMLSGFKHKKNKEEAKMKEELKESQHEISE